MTSTIDIEVVFAAPDRQVLVPIAMHAGATVAEAIEISAIAAAFPGCDLARCATGVWGRLVQRNHILSEGDRVELYRPLKMDPREARRRLAAAGKTMRQSAER